MGKTIINSNFINKLSGLPEAIYGITQIVYNLMWQLVGKR